MDYERVSIDYIERAELPYELDKDYAYTIDELKENYEIVDVYFKGKLFGLYHLVPNENNENKKEYLYCIDNDGLVVHKHVLEESKSCSDFVENVMSIGDLDLDSEDANTMSIILYCLDGCVDYEGCNYLDIYVSRKWLYKRKLDIRDYFSSLSSPFTDDQ